MKNNKIWMTAITVFSICMSSAAQENVTAPGIKTTEITTITHYSTIGGGTIISDGGSPVTKAGICWSKDKQEPELTDNSVGGKGSSFKEYLKCLEPNTTYYVRAFATNKAGTAYGNTVTFSTLSDLDGTVSDIEGNRYKTVKVGNQTWFAENLRTTRYNNGASVPTTLEEIFEEEKPEYQWPADGNEELVKQYGRLYTWHTVADKRDVCPCGWHVPANAEWLELLDNLGGLEGAGGKLKETGTNSWLSPNAGASNESGFTALPAGIRDYTTAYAWFGQSTTFWTSDENDEDDAISYTLNHINSEAVENIYSKKAGYSVRCIKD